MTTQPHKIINDVVGVKITAPPAANNAASRTITIYKQDGTEVTVELISPLGFSEIIVDLETSVIPTP